jgi:hypothetical protein
VKSKSKLSHDRRSVGQAVLVSRPLSWGTIPNCYYRQTVGSLLMWGALFDHTMSLSSTVAGGPRQRSHSQARVPRES